MGTRLSQVEHCEESFKFTQFANGPDEDEPKRPRQCTDMFFFYFMATFLVIVSSFLIYCASIGDVNRILHGYDECGNVCGLPNKRDNGEETTCVGLDMTKMPYLLLMQKTTFEEEIVERKCVDNCEKYGCNTHFGRCVPKDSTIGPKNQKNIWHMLSEDINACSTELIYMSMFSFALVVLLALLLRYATEAFIWSTLIGGCVAMILGIVGLWIGYATTNNIDNQSTYMTFAISMTIVAVVIIVYMCFIGKRIKMVIQLFKEAAKAIGAVPFILFEPAITILALGVSMALYIYLMMLIGSAGILTKISEGHYDYLPNDVVIAAGILFVASVVWLVYFFIGCQHMIVGGTIASWYFIRDKSRLRSPILYSAYNLVRYHLGTVAFGSLIMLIMQIVKCIIESMKRKMRQNGCGIFFVCCGFIFQLLEDLIRYFSKLAYIMTAMHGVPFCTGGKEAMRLLLNNGLKVLVVNTVSSFILFFIHLIVIVATCLISFQIMDKPGLHTVWFPVLASAVMACFMSFCLMTVYSTAIDTIFLCFCEDTEQNDGISKPYYMSQELMHFVENSKKVLWDSEPNEQPAQNNRPQAWNTPAPA